MTSGPDVMACGCVASLFHIVSGIAQPMGLHYNRYVSPSVRLWSVSKMFITLEPHGIY